MVVPPRRPWAVSMVLSEEFLDGLSRAGIGDGVVVPPLRNTFQLPMMGALELTLSMTIVGVTFQMRPEHDGRLLATIRASGTLEVHGDAPMPILPGVARVRGDVLVDPVVRLDPDGAFVGILDVEGSELIQIELEGIDGLPHDADIQRQLSEMLFATIGGELFAGLAERLGSVGLELGADRGRALLDLGVAPGPADITIRDGSMVVGLRAVDGLAGTARPVEVEGTRLGVGVASGALAALVGQLVRDRYGMDLPFDLDVDTRERHVGGRIRNTRLLDGRRVPDLRPGVRYTIRTRLDGDVVELTLREAWLEVPSVVPAAGSINRVNRWIGGVAARASLAVRVPARASLPVRPDSTASMRVSVVGLEVDDDGVEVTVDARL
jgi:hypothetical protein